MICKNYERGISICKYNSLFDCVSTTHNCVEEIKSLLRKGADMNIRISSRKSGDKKMRKICQNCRYFKSGGNYGSHYCRVNPPQVLLNKIINEGTSCLDGCNTSVYNYQSQYPIVSKYDGCRLWDKFVVDEKESGK